jgi:hypothetical protein
MSVQRWITPMSPQRNSRRRKHELSCRFCGLPKHQVSDVVASPHETVHICDECAALCSSSIIIGELRRWTGR